MVLESKRGLRRRGGGTSCLRGAAGGGCLWPQVQALWASTIEPAPEDGRAAAELRVARAPAAANTDTAGHPPQSGGAGKQWVGARLARFGAVCTSQGTACSDEKRK